MPECPLIADHRLTHSCTMGAFVQRYGSEVLDASLLKIRSGRFRVGLSCPREGR